MKSKHMGRKKNLYVGKATEIPRKNEKLSLFSYGYISKILFFVVCFVSVPLLAICSHVFFVCFKILLHLFLFFHFAVHFFCLYTDATEVSRNTRCTVEVNELEVRVLHSDEKKAT